MTAMRTSTTRPAASEYAPPFGKYIELVPDGDIVSILAAQLDDLQRTLVGVSESAALKLHPPYTWTVKQVVGHIIDSDRVFGHRAHWIARNGGAPLAGFDENAFMDAIDFNRWPLAELLEEFGHVRLGNIALFQHLDAAAWTRQGIVNEYPATVKAMAYVMAGHAQHHLKILQQRLGGATV
jgi:hypothetical protein